MGAECKPRQIARNSRNPAAKAAGFLGVAPVLGQCRTLMHYFCPRRYPLQIADAAFAISCGDASRTCVAANRVCPGNSRAGQAAVATRPARLVIRFLAGRVGRPAPWTALRTRSGVVDQGADERADVGHSDPA
jgi:hypothetical protein